MINDSTNTIPSPAMFVLSLLLLILLRIINGVEVHSIRIYNHNSLSGEIKVPCINFVNLRGLWYFNIKVLREVRERGFLIKSLVRQLQTHTRIKECIELKTLLHFLFIRWWK